MNKFSKLSVVLAVALAAGAASAGSLNVDPAQAPQASKRSEVVADLLVWRAAGMDSNALGAGLYDSNSPSYQEAFARYEQLRHSPQFAALVNDIERGVRPHVIVASSH